MGEHSPCDALVPSIVCEYAIVQGIEGEAFDSPDAEVGFVDMVDVIDGEEGGEVSRHRKGEGWERLEWVTDEYVGRECAEAEERAREIIRDSDDGVLWFAEYGADWMKSVGMSPTIHSTDTHTVPPLIVFCYHFLLGPQCNDATCSPPLTGRIHPDGIAARMV